MADPRTTGRLLVMAHFVYAARVGGSEYGFYNTIRGMGREAARVQIVCGDRRRFEQTALAELEALPAVSVTEAGGTFSRFLAEQLACLRLEQAADAVLFPNYYVPPVVPSRLGRVVAVIHDLQYRHIPEYQSRKRRAWLAISLPHTVRRADTVITISRFSADDVVRSFGGGVEAKLRIIPNPVCWDRFGAPDDVSPLDRPYILSVAAQYPHKNLPTLIRAFAALAKRDRDCMLVLCGQDYSVLRGTRGGVGSLEELLQSLGIADRVRVTGQVSDAELGRWYRHAALFAFPSIFEGFGVPPVEALGLRCPTLATRCTAVPEATLGLAEYVDDPFRVEEWTARMQEMLRRPANFTPSEAAAERVRAEYDTVRLGRRYLEACGV